VTYLHFPQHLIAEIGELVARCQAVEVRLILRLDLRQIEPVMVRIVEEVAL
jgi:hypothetical protein